MSDLFLELAGYINHVDAIDDEDSRYWESTFSSKKSNFHPEYLKRMELIREADGTERMIVDRAAADAAISRTSSKFEYARGPRYTNASQKIIPIRNEWTDYID